MNKNWATFLHANGATIEEGCLLNFGNAAAETAAISHGEILCDLSHQPLLKAAGADAQSFLHNQLTTDINGLTSDTSQHSAYCNPKGRVLALFHLFMHDQNIYLSLPAALLENTLKRLRMFIMMSKVTLQEEASLLHIGYAGDNAPQQLTALLDKIPSTPHSVAESDGVTVIRRAGQLPRFELVATEEKIKSLWEKLATQSTPVGAGVWEWLDIQAGTATIGSTTSEAFIPQMLNLQAINALSFSKGCYPGQEIIARTQYRGKLKRRLYLAHIEQDKLPTVDSEIIQTDSTGAKKVGTVVTAQTAPSGGVDLLAVIEIEAANQLTLHNGTPLQLQELPYPLPA